jgi:hypothetical protein
VAIIENQAANCVTLHLRSAFPLEDLETSAIQESPVGQALPRITRRHNSRRHETPRLVDQRPHYGMTRGWQGETAGYTTLRKVTFGLLVARTM